MFTSAWYKNILGRCTDATYSVTNIANGTTTVGSTSANTNLKTLLNNVTQKEGAGVVFGNGTEEPTLNDTVLSGDIVRGFSVSCAVNTLKDEENGTTGLDALYTITNNNDEAITISEIGIYFTSYHGGSQVLIERTLLETPIVIEAGGVGQITYTITSNYPTA